MVLGVVSTQVAGRYCQLAVFCVIWFYASDWLYCSMFHTMTVNEVQARNKKQYTHKAECSADNRSRRRYLGLSRQMVDHAHQKMCQWTGRCLELPLKESQL